jgi:hypothetical protein
LQLWPEGAQVVQTWLAQVPLQHSLNPWQAPPPMVQLPPELELDVLPLELLDVLPLEVEVEVEVLLDVVVVVVPPQSPPEPPAPRRGRSPFDPLPHAAPSAIRPVNAKKAR